MMCAEWRKGFDPEVILNRIDQIKQVTHDGKVGFVGWEYFDYPPALHSSLEFNPELPESARHTIIRNAISLAVKEGRPTSTRLLHLIKKEERNYLSSPTTAYTLATSLSFRRPRSLAARIALLHEVISFRHSRSVLSSRRPFLERAKDDIWGPLPDGYTPVSVSTSGRTMEEAGNKALRLINLLRGVWNFALNIRRVNRWSEGKKHPINELRLGPIHTLHQAGGSLADDIYWVEQSYIAPAKPIELSENVSHLRRFEKFLRRRMRKHWLGEFLIEGFVRYANTLDGHDFEACFQKLWSLLEYLTCTRPGEGYNDTIARACSIWPEHRLHRQILGHLRFHRNAQVHHFEASNKLETLVFQLKRYVEGLLLFYVMHGSEFQDLSAIREFLDLPPNRNALTRQGQILRLRLKHLPHQK